MVSRFLGNVYEFVSGGSEEQNQKYSNELAMNSGVIENIYKPSGKKSDKPKAKRKFIINGLELKEDNLISEGGYGFVYRVHSKDKDGNNQYFALKV